jgi:HK97 family phage portal protein
MRLIDRLLRPPEKADRAGLVELFSTWDSSKGESAPNNFLATVNGVYKRNGVVLATIGARMMLFSEVRFKFRSLQDKRLFGNERLGLLEKPWPNGTTSELLSRMEQDVSLAGNAYIYKATSTHLQRLQPDLVDIMSNGREVRGYLYYPSGRGSESTFILPEEMAHYSPIPDPSKNFLGMSWLETVVGESVADQKMVSHQDKFYENAATPAMWVKVEQQLNDDCRTRLRSEFDRRYGGWENAYKTVVLDGGASLHVVGADFQQADFVATKASNENRIAVAGGVPPVILGIQSGLENSTYSNYEQAFKQFAITLRSLWRGAADALSTLVAVPAGAELWWDETEVYALQDSAKNVNQVRQIQATTINTLITAGYTPDSVVQAVTSGDMTGLEHTGRFSVQLLPAGADEGQSNIDENVEGDGDVA